MFPKHSFQETGWATNPTPRPPDQKLQTSQETDLRRRSLSKVDRPQESGELAGDQLYLDLPFLNMPGINGPFEDVFPIENGDVPWLC